jgi:hypothetical protein
MPTDQHSALFTEGLIARLTKLVKVFIGKIEEKTVEKRKIRIIGTFFAY